MIYFDHQNNASTAAIWGSGLGFHFYHVIDPKGNHVLSFKTVTWYFKSIFLRIFWWYGHTHIPHVPLYLIKVFFVFFKVKSKEEHNILTLEVWRSAHTYQYVSKSWAPRLQWAKSAVPPARPTPPTTTILLGWSTLRRGTRSCVKAKLFAAIYCHRSVRPPTFALSCEENTERR